MQDYMKAYEIRDMRHGDPVPATFPAKGLRALRGGTRTAPWGEAGITLVRRFRCGDQGRFAAERAMALGGTVWSMKKTHASRRTGERTWLLEVSFPGVAFHGYLKGTLTLREARRIFAEEKAAGYY